MWFRCVLFGVILLGSAQAEAQKLPRHHYIVKIVPDIDSVKLKEAEIKYDEHKQQLSFIHKEFELRITKKTAVKSDTKKKTEHSWRLTNISDSRENKLLDNGIICLRWSLFGQISRADLALYEQATFIIHSSLKRTEDRGYLNRTPCRSRYIFTVTHTFRRFSVEEFQFKISPCVEKTTRFSSFWWWRK